MQKIFLKIKTNPKHKSYNINAENLFEILVKNFEYPISNTTKDYDPKKRVRYFIKKLCNQINIRFNNFNSYINDRKNPNINILYPNANPPLTIEILTHLQGADELDDERIFNKFITGNPIIINTVRTLFNEQIIYENLNTLDIRINDKKNNYISLVIEHFILKLLDNKKEISVYVTDIYGVDIQNKFCTKKIYNNCNNYEKFMIQIKKIQNKYFPPCNAKNTPTCSLYFPEIFE
jgi:hypothetical protein